MAYEIINIGTAPNDGTGDPLRTAFSKTNANFAYQINCVSVSSSSYSTSNATNYVGVSYAGPVAIALHTGYTGQRITVKDETGYASANAITLVGSIDNQSNATLQINNGSLTLIYNNGWRII